MNGELNLARFDMMMRILLLICAVVVSSCAPDAERNQPKIATGDGVETIMKLMAAFNAHNADEMRSLWHDDVKWIELTGNQLSIVTSSAEELHGELIEYFEAYPSVSSSLKDVSAVGNFVSAIETPVWKEDGERMSQSSVVVYEVIDGKVKRFWYYPPQ